MSRKGRAWFSGPTVDVALSCARNAYGLGYRVTFIRSKPDKAMGTGVLAYVEWEVIDQATVDAECERRMAPLSGLSAQAASYLAEDYQ